MPRIWVAWVSTNRSLRLEPRWMRTSGHSTGTGRFSRGPSRSATRLFELEVRALHEVLPLLDVGVEESYEVRLVVLEERDADFRQIRARLGLLEHALYVARDARAELGRNGSGGEEALPQRRLVLRQALLGDGRHVRCGGVALPARHAERPRPPRICERQADRHAGEVVGDAPRNDVLHRRRAALVGNVDRADSGHHVEELAAQVIGVADSG